MISDAPDNKWFSFSRKGRVSKASRVIRDVPDNKCSLSVGGAG